ncbi:Uma2 family endonuclease [Actinoplanes rectilineatus]|uniref:Uma2 family endonuclease n=1 Tax=Actinoplanes rectilineatus TaxID=113571 RepID=UPI0005F2AD2F|nr:Uma2 family endonuclease [Actinoplanes rectilineatus]
MTAALNLTSSELQDKEDWTVDDLASLPKGLRYELVDGRLISPSPTALHQEFCLELVLMLRAGECPPDHRPIFDMSIEINRSNEPRPDVVVIEKRYATRSPVPVAGALLVVEVVSPTSHFRDMHAKTKVYAAAKVEAYWVIDPAFEKGVALTEFRLDDSGVYEVITNTDKVFTTDVPYPVTIDLPALTALRDELRAAAD